MINKKAKKISKPEEEFDDKAYSTLIKDIKNLDGQPKKHRGRERKVRLVSQAAPSLNTSKLLKKLGDDSLLQKAKELKALQQPLQKPVAKRLKRAAGYEEVAVDANKWASVVDQRRKAQQLVFPIQEIDLRPTKVLKNFENDTKTDMEKEVYAILSGAKLMKEKKVSEEEEAVQKAMSLKEIREKSKEIWRRRLLRQRLEKKAALLNKSKSRKYHRILRRERLKLQKEDFERLKNTDPEAALEVLNELDKTRVMERMSLRHKKSKWLHMQQTRAGKDPRVKEVLQENVETCNELLEKMKPPKNDEEEYDDLLQKQESDLAQGMYDPSNAWVSQMARVGGEEEEKDKGFLKMKNFWEDVHRRKVKEKKAQQTVEEVEEKEKMELLEGVEERKRMEGVEAKVVEDMEERKRVELQKIMEKIVEAKKDQKVMKGKDVKEAQKGVKAKDAENRVKGKEVQKDVEVEKASGKRKNAKKRKLLNSERKQSEENCEEQEERKVKKRKGIDKKDLKTQISEPQKQEKLKMKKKKLNKTELENQTKNLACKKTKYNENTETKTKQSGEKTKPVMKKLGKNAKVERSNSEETPNPNTPTGDPKNLPKKLKKSSETKSPGKTKTDKKKSKKMVELPVGVAAEVYIDDLFNKAENIVREKLTQKEKSLSHSKLSSSVSSSKPPGGGNTPPAEEIEFDFSTKDHQGEMEESLVRARTMEDLETLLPPVQPQPPTVKDPFIPLEEPAKGQDRPATAAKGPVSIVNLQEDDILKIKSRRLGSTRADYSLLKGKVEGEFSDQELDDDLQQLFDDDENVREFKEEREIEEKKRDPKDIDLYLEGWGSWGGPGLNPSEKRRKKFRIKAPKKAPNKYSSVGTVIYNEQNDVHKNIRKVMVSELPAPFQSVADFEASIRQPVGRKFVPEAVHRKLTAPPVVARMGTVIPPMSEDALLKNHDQHRAKRKSNLEQKIDRQITGKARASGRRPTNKRRKINDGRKSTLVLHK